eukprot:TRINITY_DN2091_c0_g1_i14.p1 TRINITY_DN2091_c0_g1~~TRINITY_DN2091_c0_g1_i14.p1  ORF type:complete len:248 (+),score=25.81 TRINITY_DN2091_c0_g1_i14:164-907(+)
MREAHSFFILDNDYCVDVKGLLRFLAKKIEKALLCLYCENQGSHGFKSAEAVQNHMVDKGHCQMNMEHYRDFEYYYDFSKAIKTKQEQTVPITEIEDSDEEEEDWIDLDSDEETQNQRKIHPEKTKHYYYKVHNPRGQILPTGEVKLENGKIIGNRVYRAYYHQRYRPSHREETQRRYPGLVTENEERQLAVIRINGQLVRSDDNLGLKFFEQQNFSKGKEFKRKNRNLLNLGMMQNLISNKFRNPR